MKYGPYKVTIPARERWDRVTRTSTHMPAMEGYVFIEVSLDKLLANYGHRALINKSGHATEANGAVVLRKVGIGAVLHADDLRHTK